MPCKVETLTVKDAGYMAGGKNLAVARIEGAEENMCEKGRVSGFTNFDFY